MPSIPVKMSSTLCTLLTCVLLMITTSSARNWTDEVAIDVQHDIPIIIHDDGALSVLNFNYTVSSDFPLEAFFSLADTKRAEIISEVSFVMNETSSGNISLKLKGGLIGRTVLSIFVQIPTNESILEKNSTALKTYEIVVTRISRIIDQVFNYVVIGLVVSANIAMGCKVDLALVKKTLKRPIAPAVGLCSQFVFMPLVSLLVVYLLELEPAIALGYFALGCSPGGSASNIYAFILGGNISLSVTMTLVSTFCSLGLIPMWLFTVGQKVIYKGSSLVIPYENIFISLSGLLIPVIIGIIIQYKKPNWALKILKLVKPIVIIFVLFILTVGVYANLYIFSLLDAVILLAGALIPYLGFALGFIVALVTRQKREDIISIAIETGIQNTGIPIVLLRNSLNPPESDISIVSPIASAIFTPLPIVIAMIVIEIRKRWCKKKTDPKDMLGESANTSKLEEDDSPSNKSENGVSDSKINTHKGEINQYATFTKVSQDDSPVHSPGNGSSYSDNTKL